MIQRAELEEVAIRIATENQPLIAFADVMTPDNSRTVIGLVYFVRSLDEKEFDMTKVIEPTDMGYVLWGQVEAESAEAAIAIANESLVSFGVPADDIKAVNAGGGEWRVWVKYNEPAEV